MNKFTRAKLAEDLAQRSAAIANAPLWIALTLIRLARLRPDIVVANYERTTIIVVPSPGAAELGRGCQRLLTTAGFHRVWPGGRGWQWNASDR